MTREEVDRLRKHRLGYSGGELRRERNRDKEDRKRQRG
jgi:hypothetical protein